MDGCLNIEPVKIPRPQFYSHVDLAIMAKKEKVNFYCGLYVLVAKRRVRRNGRDGKGQQGQMRR